MLVDKQTRDLLIKIYEERQILLEGNLAKILVPESDDQKFKDYLKIAVDRDNDNRRKRLEITKKIQSQNVDLLKGQEENDRINKELTIALKNAEDATKRAEKATQAAEADLDILQKKKQNELVGLIVKVALSIIGAIGIITTLMYALSMYYNKDTQIIGSTWSNMFGILLTNAFSIVGTIMGVKYASQRSSE
jgi:hypothetical protein